MKNEGPRIFPLGESAITVEFGSEISIELNQKAIALSEFFASHPFPGFIEAAPAYSSASIYYDPVIVRRYFKAQKPVYECVTDLIVEALDKSGFTEISERPVVEIPVNFAGENSPDMDFVSTQSGLEPAEVINIFTSVEYRVFMLGFLPGFAYMGEVDARLHMPRREQPRQSVPCGSVAIGGRQTGVYSLPSPGGWRIIGRTETEMFTPDAASCCLLRAGDRVRFKNLS